MKLSEALVLKSRGEEDYSWRVEGMEEETIPLYIYLALQHWMEEKRIEAGGIEDDLKALLAPGEECVTRASAEPK